MSRSRKKTPIFGNGRGSDKQGKRFANRALRTRTHMILRDSVVLLDKDVTYPVLREVSNVWDWPKDGKSYDKDASVQRMRK